MSIPVEAGPRPMRVLKTCQVELACAIERTSAIARWRERLQDLQVVWVERYDNPPQFAGVTWYLELRSGDWSIETASYDPFDAVDLREFRTELISLGWHREDLQHERLQRMVRLSLRRAIARAKANLAPHLREVFARPPTIR